MLTSDGEVTIIGVSDCLSAAGPPASAIQVQRAPLSLVQVPAAPRHLGRGAGVLGGVLGDGTQFQVNFTYLLTCSPFRF